MRVFGQVFFAPLRRDVRLAVLDQPESAAGQDDSVVLSTLLGFELPPRPFVFAAVIRELRTVLERVRRRKLAVVVGIMRLCQHA